MSQAVLIVSLLKYSTQYQIRVFALKVIYIFLINIRYFFDYN